MVSAKALCYNDKKTHSILDIDDSHRPCAAQIFGSEPDIMAEGARRALAISRAEAIDINMGCPVHKITANGEGSALMRDPALASRIIRAVTEAVSVPVTVKFRKGYEEGEDTALSFALMAQDSGAAAVCVHGRTRSQLYGGVSDNAVIARVKRALSIPVIASGDALTPAACLDILAQTGADYVMIARGALGNPFIFRGCESLWRGVAPVPVCIGEFFDIMERHVRLTVQRKGEARAMPEIRKHMLWYLGRLRGGKPFKARMSAVSTLAEFEALMGGLRAAETGLKELRNG
jgi:tRNA-dihydrouridine synthase B